MVTNPQPVDIHVGQRLRLRRTLLGMTQVKLGEAVGLTFQQIQKYERGTNRIGSSRLFQFSQVLDVPISFFFDDMSPDVAQSFPGVREASGEVFRGDQMSRRETLDLVRAYYRISDRRVRRRIIDLARSVAMMGTEVGADDEPENLGAPDVEGEGKRLN